ncbi:MAG TPA: MFS transporter [Burkholderiales bacterium]
MAIATGGWTEGETRTQGREHRWKVLGVGVAANVSFFAAFAGLPATAVLMRTSYHLSNAQLGFALGLLGLGTAISEVPWGLLTDRLGDRRVLLMGLIATTAMLVLMALADAPRGFLFSHEALPTPLMLAGGLFMVGFLGGSINGASGRAVMAWFREGERGFAMSVRQTAVPAGGGLGALILPALIDHWGYVPAYVLLAFACALSAFFTWRWLHEPPLEHGAHGGATTRTASRGPLRDPQIWRVAGAIGLLCAPQCAVVAFATVFLHDFSHAGLAAASLAMGLVQAGAAISRIASGRWTDRHRNRRAFLRGCSVATTVIFGALALAIVAAEHGLLAAASPLIFILLVAGGICGSAWHGVAFTELATLAGAARAGTALGLGNTFAFVSLFLTSTVIPWLLPLGAWPLAWLVVTVCALLATPVFPRQPV